MPIAGQKDCMKVLCFFTHQTQNEEVIMEDSADENTRGNCACRIGALYMSADRSFCTQKLLIDAI